MSATNASDPPGDTAPIPAVATKEEIGEANAKLLKLQQDLLALHEKILGIREKDLYDVRHTVDGLDLRIKVGLIVGTLVIGALGALGFKQIGDVDKLVATSIKTHIGESLGYYDQAAKAIYLERNRGCASAIELYRDLANQRPDDDLIFANLMNCLNETEQFEAGLDYFDRMKKLGAFPGKMDLPMAYNNAGWMLTVNSFKDGNLAAQAEEILKKADNLGVASDSPELHYVIANLAILELSMGNIDAAKRYAQRRNSMPGEALNFSGDERRRWFKALLEKRKTAKQELEVLFPGSFSPPPK
ncbi:MAG: hypothetical protein E6H58_06520 [Betaproteobacteria bacterium]|nr:MAG: hypothetical protein E6H58_06520 [Betaproteobacteria bacterium]